MIRLVDPLTNPDWDSLVAGHPDATIFHSSAWASVLHDSYGHEIFGLIDVHGGSTHGLLPIAGVRSWLTGRRGVSLPFSDHAGVLEFRQKSASRLANAARLLARDRGWHHVELRTRRGARPTFIGHELDLSEFPACLPAPVRRGVQKAVRSGLTTDVQSGRDALEEFYRLHVATRRRHGVPPQPWKFFESIQRHVLSNGLGFVVLARSGSQAIAASVFLVWGHSAVFKFGASDLTFQSLRPNNLVLWTGLREAARRGAQFVDFGRTSPGNIGLLRFKRGWSTREFPIHYERQTPNGESLPAMAKEAGWSNGICRNLPGTLNRWFGAAAYRHLD
ncbi:MAG: GNAT family N-acetyltransferase [Terrimicrobiaceae bacterium]|nr:GNAT family N-acetyltransferase [Terrimicrobiaceae bacterium]